MLRESSLATNRSVDVRGVADRTVDPLVTGGEVLLDLVDSVLDGSGTARAIRRVRDVLGDAALVDAAGVIGNFEMMNRIADGTGIPVGGAARAAGADIIAALGIEAWAPH